MNPTTRRLVLTGLVALAAIVGCGDDDNGPVVPEPEQIFDLLAAHGASYLNDTADCPGLISASDLHADRELAEPRYHLLDLRSQAEFDAGHIDGATRTSLATLLADVASLEKTAPIVVTCATGQEAGWAKLALELLGWENVRSLAFGMASWNRSQSSPWNEAIDDLLTTPETTANNGGLVAHAYPELTATDLAAALAGRAGALLGMSFATRNLTYAEYLALDAAKDTEIFVLYYGTQAGYDSPGHIPGAYHFPAGQSLAPGQMLQYLPTDRKILVYSPTGELSAQVVAYLLMLGYDSYNLDHGANNLFHSQLALGVDRWDEADDAHDFDLVPHDDDPPPIEQTCIACHSSEDRLKEALGIDAQRRIASFDKDDGCGGIVFELEAWQKVIITGTNGNQFLDHVHGPNYTGDDGHPSPLQCQSCHGGAADATFTTMEEAHAGMIADPSAMGIPACKACHTSEQWTTACDGCHAEIAAANANSLHTNLWGYNKAIEDRCACEFAALGAAVQSGFQANCAGCHTTCGQCHVSRPNSVGGGFPFIAETSYSHRFRRTPDMTEQCTACHGSRIAQDFLGYPEPIPGNQPDVHRLQNGMRCTSCHGAEELHGDSQHTGIHYVNRYEVQTMPRCEGCHADDVVVFTNPGGACTECHVNGFGEPPVVPLEWLNHAHHTPGGNGNCGHCHDPVPATTPPSMQCQACHSQPYKNCTNCHNLTSVGGEYEIDPSLVQFKIARNLDPYREEYDITVVRHVPVDPNTYSEWGLALPDYTSEPTWVYASPHNIRAQTPQTAVAEGQSCTAACHGSAEVVTGFLLRESDLRDVSGNPLPDYDANIGIVIPPSFPGGPR